MCGAIGSYFMPIVICMSRHIHVRVHLLFGCSSVGACGASRQWCVCRVAERLLDCVFQSFGGSQPLFSVPPACYLVPVMLASPRTHARTQTHELPLSCLFLGIQPQVLCVCMHSTRRKLCKHHMNRCSLITSFVAIGFWYLHVLCVARRHSQFRACVCVCVHIEQSGPR